MTNNWMTKRSKLCLFGGIMINCDGPGTDRFLPLKLELRSKTGKEDLFEKVFKCQPIHSKQNPFVKMKTTKGEEETKSDST